MLLPKAWTADGARTFRGAFTRRMLCKLGTRATSDSTSMCSKYVRVIDQSAANEMPLPSPPRRFRSTLTLRIRSGLEQAATRSICSRRRSDRSVCRRRSGRESPTFCMTSLHLFTHISTSQRPSRLRQDSHLVKSNTISLRSCCLDRNSHLGRNP